MKHAKLEKALAAMPRESNLSRQKVFREVARKELLEGTDEEAIKAIAMYYNNLPAVTAVDLRPFVATKEDRQEIESVLKRLKQLRKKNLPILHSSVMDRLEHHFSITLQHLKAAAPKSIRQRKQKAARKKRTR